MSIVCVFNKQNEIQIGIIKQNAIILHLKSNKGTPTRGVSINLIR